MKEINGDKGVEDTFELPVDSRTAALFIGIHYKTLEQMARMHLVPATKFGKSWQFLLSLLSEWRKEQMNSNLNKPAPPKNNEQKESEDE
jgi:hypothetical protein